MFVKTKTALLARDDKFKLILLIKTFNNLIKRSNNSICSLKNTFGRILTEC